MPITKVHEQPKLYLPEGEVRDAEIVHTDYQVDESNSGEIVGTDYIRIEGKVYCVHWGLNLDEWDKEYLETSADNAEPADQNVQVYRAVQRRAMVWQRK